ncbi:MAG: hypothetical protein AAF466_13595 [Bacteroidota bacterium]
MKRIEEKLKEIEVKDRANRRLFRGVVILISSLMFSSLYFGTAISKRNKTIALSEVTISEMDETIFEQKVEQSETYRKLDASYDSLRRSLRPREYWEYIRTEHSVEGYISYITNNWGIDKTPYLPRAINNLRTSAPEASGFRGWLWVGYKYNNGTYVSGDVVEVIYRENSAGNDVRYSEIKKGDIVQLTTTRNRKTYRYRHLKPSSTNMHGWRNKTKGYVTDVWKKPGTSELIIEIKYY